MITASRFWAASSVRSRIYSDEIAREIDDEIRRIVESAHQRAKDILLAHHAMLDAGADALLARESLEQDELIALFEHHDRRSRLTVVGTSPA